METLIEDTLTFLRLVILDNETPEIIKSTASSILNSWENKNQTLKEK